MKNLSKGFTALLICGALNFGLNFGNAEAAEVAESNAIASASGTLNVDSNQFETQDLRGYGPPPPPPPHRDHYGPPPPHPHHRPGPPPPPYYDDYGPPPPPGHHRPGPPPPPYYRR